MRALIPHLGVPVAQIGVGHLACHVEHHDAHVSAEVVSRMQLIERLLSCCVPNVYIKSQVTLAFSILDFCLRDFDDESDTYRLCKSCS